MHKTSVSTKLANKSKVMNANKMMKSRQMIESNDKPRKQGKANLM